MNKDELRVNQFIGMVVGLVGSLMTANFWPTIKNNVGGWSGAILWGLALGGLFGSIGYLNKIGQYVSRSNNKTLNSIVGLLLPFTLIAILLVLMRISSGAQ